ncbi:MAG: NADH:flavin oxidoreductase [Bacteroidia bacterium]|nr:NADH:flavin oxidoreductase [Bacteroidia bacterium]
MESPIFTPCKIGPIELRNRTIRSAAFENMATDNKPSELLYNYHVAVSRGGVGMTTVAYAAVNRSGLSFNGQLLMCEEAVPELKRLTDAIHAEGARASIQIGHCGNMTHRSTCGCLPLGASRGFNMYSPTFHAKLNEKEILGLIKDFGDAVRLARKAGFDCVEIHAGHGYLISQFLSPYTNRRHDRWGGSLENRMRFMQEVVRECLDAAGDDIAVVVKTNMFDGMRRGLDEGECLKVAKELQRLGVHALVLTAGFVSCAPMEVMAGAMPIKTLIHYMPWKTMWWLKAMIWLGGKMMIKEVPYKDAYFYERAMRFRKELTMPLIYVGGMVDINDMEKVVGSGFVAFQMARALVNDTDFVNKLHSGELTKSPCGHSNYCIGRMYSEPMICHHCVKEKMPKKIEREVERLEARVKS